MGGLNTLHLETCRDLDRYAKAGTEPTLDEVLHEPVIRLMMKCDSVTKDQLRHVIRLARRQINAMHKKGAGSVASSICVDRLGPE
jgi:hypothetical protein